MTDQERNELSRWLEELADPNRVRYIIDKIQIYSEAVTPVQGLVFCSRREEAKRLSDLFNQLMVIPNALALLALSALVVRAAKGSK